MKNAVDYRCACCNTQTTAARITMQLDLSTKPVAKAAFTIMREAHRGQVRKYTGDPYEVHPIAVAEILVRRSVVNERVLAAALMHDVLEDTDFSPDVIKSTCGSVVLSYVVALTDNEKGNRAQRKEAARKRLSGSPPVVQAIKLADLIDNTSSIVEHDPKFARLYLEEKKALIDSLDGARRHWPDLWNEARESYTNGLNKLALADLNIGLALQANVEANKAELDRLVYEESLLDMREFALF